MSIQNSDLEKAYQKPVVVTSPTLKIVGVLLNYVERGGKTWLNLGNGQETSITEDMEIQELPIDGTFDFVTAPSERFTPIFAAYDHYGETPNRRRNTCNCGRCQTVVAPSNCDANGIPIDDLGTQDTPPTIVGNGPCR